MNTNVLKQRAVVSEIREDCVVVTILQKSACSGCHAASACTSADKKERHVTVFSPQEHFEKGESVMLCGRQTMGNVAILLSFVVPLVVLIIAAIIATYALHLSEAYSALFTLGSVGVYFVILSMFRKSLKSKFVFTLEKIHSNENI